LNNAPKSVDIVVHDGKIRDIDELRESIVEEREWLDQSVVNLSITEWRCRLRACVKARGGHFEHKL